jgi:magnesium-transporting ATPase (P-type)
MKPVANQTPGLFKRSAIVFAVTIMVTLYWYLPLLINVYRFPVISATYEILWIFMLVGLFALPVVSFIFWVRNKFNHRSLYFYSLIISLASILFLVTSK